MTIIWITLGAVALLVWGMPLWAWLHHTKRLKNGE